MPARDGIDDGAPLAHFRSLRRSGLLVQAGPVFWVVLCGAILISVIVVGAGIMTSNFRERELHRSEKELENTVLLLARQFDRQFAEFESIQKSVAAEIRQKISSPEEFKRLVSGVEFHRFLHGKISDAVDSAGVNIFDANGDFVNSSERWPVPAINLSDRNYFKAFKFDPNASPVQIEVVKSRISRDGAGRYTIAVARKITGPGGEFLGMTTRGMPPENIESYLASVGQRHGSIVLLHRDGTLLARFPHADDTIGRNFADAPLAVAAASAAGSVKTTRLISPIDGEERLGSVRNFDHYPMLVLATTTVSAALSDWREQTRALVWAAALVAAIICLTLTFIVRYLKAQHRRLDVAVNNMAQGLLLFDASERLVVCNRRYIEIFKLSPEVVKPGCQFRDIIQHRKDTGSFDGSVDEYCERVRQAPRTGKPNQNSVVTPDGRWMQIVNQPLAGGGWVSTIEDITERRLAEERTVRLALYDTLTDLPNRASFLKHLQAELDRCSVAEKVAVLFLDIDEFKAVNDSLGHHVGDELLKLMARNLQSCLGPNEFVARLGGDEFAVVASQVGHQDEVLALVERIFEAIRRPQDCAGNRLTIDSSIGIALAPTDGTSCEEILQNADLAMYEAKSAGRRTHRFFEGGMEKKAKERRLLELDLREATKNGEINVYYQPIADLRRNEIVACEALARWSHPSRGFVSPADFIPVAEQSGLIEELGEYVLRKACNEAATWPDHIKLAVNVSPVQFKSGLFALKVVAALAESGLSAHRLELEITEAVLIGDDEAALKILHELRVIGVRVALDDFGTGYSSLSYLRRFPFDKIKIDRSFVGGLADENGSLGIVRAVVAMASEYNIATTAEGVETEQQRDMLRQLQCTEMQGFLLSPPKPAQQLKEFLQGLPQFTRASA